MLWYKHNGAKQQLCMTVTSLRPNLCCNMLVLPMILHRVSTTRGRGCGQTHVFKHA